MPDHPDEYNQGPNGELIGMNWADTHPRSLLRRILNLENQVEELQKLVGQANFNK